MTVSDQDFFNIARVTGFAFMLGGTSISLLGISIVWGVDIIEFIGRKCL